MEEKINYYNISLQEIEEIKKRKAKPTILVHVCCGPCACFPILFLCPFFKVTLYYDNSNIYPEDEFHKRLEELKKLLKNFHHDYGYDVQLVTAKYDYQNYVKDLLPFKDEQEGQNRCKICFTKRLKSAFRYASDNHYDYISTVMTISSHKNSQVINSIGKELSSNYPNVKYFYSDFKKNNGELIGRQMRNAYSLYQQNYCGCEFSKNNIKK